MKNNRRISALFLALIMILSCALASCSHKDKNNISDDECILTCAGNDISYGLYRYFFLNYKANYTEEELAERPGEIYAEIEEDCFESLCGVYAVVAMCSEYGIGISDSDIKGQVDATIASICEQNINEENDKTGVKGYKKQLAANFMTEDVLRFVLSVDYAEERLFMKMTGEGGVIKSDDDTVRRAFDEEFVRVLQVYINTSETDKSYDECKKLALDIEKKAKSGEDFDTLVANYSNDYTMTRDGYYMPRGWMNESFEEVAFALEVGETSDVLELADGFHIIKRYDMEDEYVEKNLETLKERYLTCKFYDRVDAKAESLKVTKTERFSSIKAEHIALS